MLGGVASPGAALRSEHHRDTGLPAEHEAVLRGLVHDLVHRKAGEVDVHELNDRAETGQGGTDGRPDDPDLADRRLADPSGPELVEEAGGNLESAAVLGDVFADHDDPFVTLHLEAKRVAERLVVEHFARRGGGTRLSRLHIRPRAI